jgi:hypothetical protein
MRTRQSTIKGHAALCDDKRLPAHDPFVESLVKVRTVLCQDAVSNSDACIAQPPDTSTVMVRIHVHRADNYCPDSSLENRFGARSSAPNRGTGFERNVEGCASRHFRAEVSETFDLSVFMTRSSVMSFCHNAIVNDQHCADSGIGARLTLCFFGFLQRLAHELFISLCHPRHGHTDSGDY